jgi:hypothetical protein
VTETQPRPHDGPDLVPGELRGYRQFELRDDGLYPLVHAEFGPWEGELEQARCALGKVHPAPDPDCRCGLYGWYLPGSATVAVGPVSAVVSVRGKCILGDRGFRAAAAHIEAVALPATVRWHRPAARRVHAMLAEKYPETLVYGSVRRMLREHPPHDVSALGIRPPRDRSRGYRMAVIGLWLLVLVTTYALAALSRDGVVVSRWWPAMLVLAIAWQAGMVVLFAKLLNLQGTKPSGPPTQPR